LALASLSSKGTAAEGIGPVTEQRWPP